MRIVKVGGSLLDNARSVMQVLKEHVVLVVPGGGVFADTIRKVYNDLVISEETAHQMAILAMAQYGYLLSDISGVPFTMNIHVKKGPAVYIPSDEIEFSGLEASWDVGSDTIALFVAKQRGETSFIKLTDVDGLILDGRLRSWVKAGKLLNTTSCVDKSLPFYLLEWRMNCRVVNGTIKENISKTLEGKNIGTLIKGGN